MRTPRIYPRPREHELDPDLEIAAIRARLRGGYRSRFPGPAVLGRVKSDVFWLLQELDRRQQVSTADAMRTSAQARADVVGQAAALRNPQPMNDRDSFAADRTTQPGGPDGDSS